MSNETRDFISQCATKKRMTKYFPLVRIYIDFNYISISCLNSMFQGYVEQYATEFYFLTHSKRTITVHTDEIYE